MPKVSNIVLYESYNHNTMQLTPSQQNKIEKIAKFLDDSNIATVESFMELDEKLTGLEEKMDKIIDEKTQEIQVIEKECFDFTEVLKKLDEPLEVEVTLNIL
jgi:antitoxin component YwqK of YwqJK toxin-antitoxin module